MTGWIKLHRSINEWDWKTKPLTTALFIHLLANVNHKQGSWRGKTIHAGQIVTGRRKLARDTGLTEMQIRTALKHLKSTNDITIQASKEYSIISITNWEKYQESNPQINQPITNEQPTDNQPITTNKNNNNKKNEKNKEKEIVIPDFINGDLWIDWIQHRKEIKKALTPTQSKKQINQLTAWNAAGHDVNKIISDSIQNGWQGLFKPKGENNGKQTRSANLAEQARKLMEQYPD